MLKNYLMIYSSFALSPGDLYLRGRVKKYNCSIKPNRLLGRGGRRRVLSERDGRAAEGFKKSVACLAFLLMLHSRTWRDKVIEGAYVQRQRCRA